MVKFPCAHDAASSAVVFALHAIKKRKYACIECTSDVVVHRGLKRAAHFSHVGGAKGKPGCAGGGESAAHRATKEWLCSIASDPAFVVWTTCAGCMTAFEVFRGHPRMEARTEWRWNNGQYVLDVAIADKQEQRLCAVVEVLHTHAAGPQKRKTIEAADWRPVPVAEVKSVDLVGANWPRRFECVSPRRCSGCLADGWKRFWATYGRQNRINAWFAAALRRARARQKRRGAEAEAVARVQAAERQREIRVAAAQAEAVARVQAAERQREIRVAAAQAAAFECVVAAVLDDAVRTVLATTGQIARRWLFRARCRSLVARLKLRCLSCGDRTRDGKWCACKRARMGKCASCDRWTDKSTLHETLPVPGRSEHPLRACTLCTKPCATCDAHFIVSPQFEYAVRCFRCNYSKKHGHAWSPNEDGHDEGECTECGKYIKTTQYGHKCYSCNRF